MTDKMQDKVFNALVDLVTEAKADTEAELGIVTLHKEETEPSNSTKTIAGVVFGEFVNTMNDFMRRELQKRLDLIH